MRDELLGMRRDLIRAQAHAMVVQERLALINDVHAKHARDELGELDDVLARAREALDEVVDRLRNA